MRDIQTLYKRLEEETESPHYRMNFDQIIREFIGDPKDVDEETLQKARFEDDFLSLVLNQNGLVAQRYLTDKDGLPFELPDITKFTDDQLDYLTMRLKEAKSLFLRARYSHILWLSPRKKIEYARTTVDTYRELSQFYYGKDKKEPGQGHYLLAFNCLVNGFKLSYSVRYLRTELKNDVLDMLFRLDRKAKNSTFFGIKLVEFMLEKRNIYKKEDLKGITKKLNDLRKTIKLTDNHAQENILKVILKVGKKLSKDLKPWHELMGQTLEAETRGRKDGSFVTTDFCRQAIASYKKAGNQEKVEELTRLYGKLKGEVELNSVGQDIDVSDLIAEAKKMANAVAKMSANDILTLISNDTRFIPSKEQTLKTTREASKNNFLAMINSSVIDERGHTVRHYTTEEEKEFEQLMFNYKIELELWNFNLLKETLFESIYAGKIDYRSVLSYLSSHTWYGQELEFSSRMDTEVSGKWLAQLAPSIVEFFLAVNQVLYSDQPNYSIVSSFDSMTVKIEGLLRALAEYSQIDTFLMKPDKAGRQISEEKDIMRLLTEPKLIELIGEDDCLFLRFLFTERSGYNLRNRVAHGLMKYNNYSLGTMMFIFLAIMRLSRFSLRPKN